MKYRHIFFDLDGTLTDSAEGITKCVAHALNRFDIEVDNLSDLNKFVGPPLFDSFIEYYGFSQEDAKLATEVFRERFSTIGKFENKVYPGIEELLEQLNQQEYKLYVATSKPTIFAKEILEHFGLAKFFVDIVGAELNGDRTEKAEVIKYVIQNHNLSAKDKIVMIGDRLHDVLGAKENEIPVIGVLYGYGSREELETYHADYIVETVAELGQRLMTDGYK